MMRRNRAVALAQCAVLACSIGGCDKWLTKPSLYSSVDVIVATRRGLPVSGANLILYTGQRPMGYGATDADGHYTFARVPQGLYGVSVTPPPGYALLESLIGGVSTSFVDDLHIANGDSLAPVRFTFLKPGPGALTVRVAQPDGSPIPDVTVIAYDPSQKNDSAVTNTSGVVSFPSLAYGVHGVVVLRPMFYRDHVTLNDSLFTFRDGIVVDDGSRDSISIHLQRCAGSVRVLVTDPAGAPLRGATLVAYNTIQELGIGATGADGRLTLPNIPCVRQFGVLVTPPPNFTVAEGRGSRFIDGLTTRNGGIVDVTFRLQPR